MYVVGSPPWKGETRGKREKGREGKSERGNYPGGVYTYGVFVCTRMAMGLEGDRPHHPQGGAVPHSSAPSFSSLHSTCLQ